MTICANCQNGSAIPLVRSDDGNVAFFSTIEEAERAGKENFLGSWYGFEVFVRGSGKLC